MPSFRVTKKSSKDDRRPCRLCGVNLSRRARYQHSRYRSCVKAKQPITTATTSNVPEAYETSDETASESDENSDITEPMFNDCTREHDISSSHEQHTTLEGNDDNAENVCTAEENSSDSSASNDEEAEEWDGVGPDDLLQDMNTAMNTPLDPGTPSTFMSQQKALVTWLLYFLLVWQTACHLSDNGLEWLLQFLSKFLHLVGLQSSYVAGIASIFPGTLYLMRTFMGLDRDKFQRYVVCPKCTKLYKPDQCTRIVNGHLVGLHCTQIIKYRRRTKECGHQLVKEVVLTNNKSIFYPLKTYCYNSIIETLERFVKRKGFTEKCEQWRDRNVNTGDYGDVFDGQVWKDFMDYKNQPFLRKPRNYTFMMNCDWFQPFKRRSDFSVGVIYMVLNNLPREERFKRENVFLVGIIPALSKEPASLNTFLGPLVDELKVLWKGLRFVTSSSPLFPLTFRAALLCASSDIPAARKLCGFMGHAARLGCSRCFKSFPGGFAEKRDYSGFDRADWPYRTNQEQRRRVARLARTRSITKQKKLESELGVRYTALLELEYYDAVRFCVIDPMHNIFLGTAKSMFKLWIDRGILSHHDLSKLDAKISTMNVMTDVGRIPSKISSNYGSYTAEEWKNWTMLYSIFCLKGLLPDNDLKCWQSFVLACRTLVRPYITGDDVRKGDHLLMTFCREVEVLYGGLAVKPNMHLHGHLKDCIIDYGPLYGFGAFSFERYNGLLGNFKTNNKNPELQIMRKFLVCSFAGNGSLPHEYAEDFMSLIPHQDDVQYSTDSSRELYLASSSPIPDVKWDDLKMVYLPERFVRATLNGDDLQLLRSVYQVLYPTIDLSNCVLGQVIKKYNSVELGTASYGSWMSCRSLRSARVRAAWTLSNGGVNSTSLDVRPGFVRSYFSHEIKINMSWKRHVFASMTWYKEHPSKDYFGSPIEVWQEKTLDMEGSSTFMPVQRIVGKFAAASQKVLDIDSLVICSVPPKIFV